MKASEDQKANMRQRYVDNSESVKARSRQRYVDNSESVKAGVRAYALKNRDSIKVRMSAYSSTPEMKERRRLCFLKPESKSKRQRYLLKKHYGITPEQVEQMTTEQGCACAVCFRVSRLVVDHNHSTGKVRAMLCSSCNTAIGLLQESLIVLESAKAYLQKHKTL